MEKAERGFSFLIPHSWHQFFSNAPPEKKDISDTFSSKFSRQPFWHPVLRVLQHPGHGCSAFGNVQKISSNELIVIARTVAVIWRNQREGRKDPTVFSIQELRGKPLQMWPLRAKILKGWKKFDGRRWWFLCSVKQWLSCTLFNTKWKLIIKKKRSGDLYLLIFYLLLKSHPFWRGQG